MNCFWFTITCMLVALSFPVASVHSNKAKILKATLGPYPGSTSPYTLQGKVVVRFLANNSMIFRYHLKGHGDPLCTTSPGCGINIHGGTNCTQDVFVGGHFWTPSTIADPWLVPQAKYVLTPAGKSGKKFVSNGNYTITNGYDEKENRGRVVVVHQYDGSRIACGVLN